MNNIPTAEEFFNKYGGYTREEMLERSIEFAKLHVKQALLQASNLANITPIMRECNCEISKTSILNAYLEDNIK